MFHTITTVIRFWIRRSRYAPRPMEWQRGRIRRSPSLYMYLSRWERLCKPTITLALRFNISFWDVSFLQCIFLSFSIRDLRGWGLELLLVAIAIYRLRILLGGRWRVYCREQRQAGGLMAPYPANCSIIWSNSPTNLIQPSYNRARNTQVFHGKLYFNWFT